MSSLKQLLAGIAHEIDNPINFIQGNLLIANTYAYDLLNLLNLYQKHCSNPPAEIQEATENCDIDFLTDDLRKLLSSMKVGAERIHQIVQSLWNFSRLGGISMKSVDIHEGIENTRRQSEAREREKTAQLELLLRELQQSQAKLIQAEKMSSLGQLVVGIAQEINGPTGFIYSNLDFVSECVQDLLNLINLYQKHYPNPPAEIQEAIENCDIDFLTDDLPKLLSSMKVGAEQIRQIAQSLQNFSRSGETSMK
ncbi:MAG: hypothetical protein ACOC07_17165 [Coleofasciculus sp.]